MTTWHSRTTSPKHNTNYDVPLRDLWRHSQGEENLAGKILVHNENLAHPYKTTPPYEDANQNTTNL
jgi:hypothetical protein